VAATRVGAPLKPLDVLFAIPELDRGGPDRVLFELLCALDRERFRLRLMTSTRAGHYLSQLPGDVTVDVVGEGERYPVRAALGHVRTTRPAVVLATQRMILTLGIAAVGFPRRTALVLRQANDFSADATAQGAWKHRVARGAAMLALRRSDAVVCQSHAMQADLVRHLGPRAKLHVIGNPIDLAAVARATSGPLPSIRGKPALASVGRLGQQKGYDLLLAALPRVRARYPQVHLTILGDGPDRAELLHQAHALSVADAVTFAGFSRAPLPLVRAADLFVLASRYEGFPNAALEALACGTPVVLTDCPGANAELVVPGRDGRLAARVTPDAMADAILAALDDHYDRTAIIARCAERYSARRIAAAYGDLFVEVAATR
jgi:glycosyltransferase involved in cell wall biosynthesis